MKSIQRSEKVDQRRKMNKCMLSWEQEIISYTHRDKDFTVLMETGKGIHKLQQVVLGES